MMKRQNKRNAVVTGLLLLIAGGSVMAADAAPVVDTGTNGVDAYLNSPCVINGSRTCHVLRRSCENQECAGYNDA